MNVVINGNQTELMMKIGQEGEAYFVEKVEKLSEEDSVVNSPISTKKYSKFLQEKSSKS